MRVNSNAERGRRDDRVDVIQTHQAIRCRFCSAKDMYVINKCLLLSIFANNVKPHHVEDVVKTPTFIVSTIP